MEDSVKSVEGDKIKDLKEQNNQEMEISKDHGASGLAGKRDSNFELLRIIAMLMIIVFHIVRHCVTVQIEGGDDYINISNTLFNHPLFYKKLFLLNAIMPWGQTGNAIFLLMSGYFALFKGKNIKLFKISKKLLLQLFFAAATLVVVSRLVYMYSGRRHFFSLYYITRLNYMSWFVGYYFIVILLAALFLNKFLLKLDEKQFATFLIVFFALITFTWTRTVIDGIGEGLSIVATGVFCYAFGGYIRNFNPFRRIRAFVFFLIPFVIYVFIYISAYNTTQTNIEKFNILNVNGDQVFTQDFTIYDTISFVVIVLAICIFEIFRRIRIPHLRIVNFLGQTTFMVYLIHDNPFFYSVWGLKDWGLCLYETPILFLIDLAKWGGRLLHAEWRRMLYICCSRKCLNRQAAFI